MTKLAPNIPKWSQMVLKWPQCRKIDFRDRDWSAIILHLEAKIAPNGPKWSQMIPNCPKWSQIVPNGPKWSQNDLSVFKLTSETISIGFLLLLRSFWVVTWLAYDNFKFRPKNSPIIASNGPKWSWNDLSILKLTSETISIGFLLLLRSFWVVTWLVCDNFKFRPKTSPK